MKNYKSILKKVLCASTALAISVGMLSGCKGKDKDKNGDKTNSGVTTDVQDISNKDNGKFSFVYNQTPFDAGLECTYVNSIAGSSDGKLYVSYDTEEEEYKLAIVDYASKSAVELETPEEFKNSYASSFGKFGDGSYAVYSKYESASGLKEDEVDWEDQEQVDKYYAETTTTLTLVKFDASGKVIDKKEISKQVNKTSTDGEDEVSDEKNLEHFCAAGDGFLAVYNSWSEDSMGYTYVFFDADGNKGEEKEFKGVGYISSVQPLSNGNVMISYQDDSTYTGAFMTFDAEKKEFSEGKSLEDESMKFDTFNMAAAEEGSEYDVYIYSYSSDGLYGYNFESNKITPVINWVNSSINGNNVNGIAAVSNKEFIAAIASSEGSGTQFCTLTEADPEALANMKTITLAVNYTSSDVTDLISSYNSSQDDYRIIIKDYGKYDTEENGYEGGATQLKNDIAAGNIPDIIMTSQLDQSIINDLAAKDGLVDLYTLIDKDSGIDKSDFAPNVLKSLEKGGKLIALTDSFQAATWVGAKEDLGDYADGWTIKELADFYKNKPAGKTFFSSGDLTSDNVLNYTLASLDTFVDFENGTCNFDTPDFVELLKFIQDMPKDSIEALTGQDTSNWSEDDWDNFYNSEESDGIFSYDEEAELKYRNKEAFVCEAYLYNMRQYQEIKEGTFGRDIVFVGYPSVNGSAGAKIYAQNAFGISSQSQYQEQCWDFIKQLVSDEHQSEIEWTFPISMKRLNELADEATKPETYDDGKGNKVEYPSTAYIGGQEIEIGEASREELQSFVDYITSIDGTVNYDNDLLEIINEEIDAFRNGDRTAEETAKQIQSRLSIYLSERS